MGRVGQRHVDDVLGVPAELNRAQIVRRGDDALRQKEARRQFAVVAGRAHDDGERPIVDANLERLFGGRAIERRLALSIPHTDDRYFDARHQT